MLGTRRSRRTTRGISGPSSFWRSRGSRRRGHSRGGPPSDRLAARLEPALAAGRRPCGGPAPRPATKRSGPAGATSGPAAVRSGAEGSRASGRGMIAPGKAGLAHPVGQRGQEIAVRPARAPAGQGRLQAEAGPRRSPTSLRTRRTLRPAGRRRPARRSGSSACPGRRGTTASGPPRSGSGSGEDRGPRRRGLRARPGRPRGLVASRGGPQRARERVDAALVRAAGERDEPGLRRSKPGSRASPGLRAPEGPATAPASKRITAGPSAARRRGRLLEGPPGPAGAPAAGSEARNSSIPSRPAAEARRT